MVLTILPKLCYEVIFILITMSDFTCDISANHGHHFVEIADNPTHLLFNYIQHNTCRTSSHKPTVFRAELCRTGAELPNMPNHFFNFS